MKKVVTNQLDAPKLHNGKLNAPSVVIDLLSKLDGCNVRTLVAQCAISRALSNDKEYMRVHKSELNGVNFAEYCENNFGLKKSQSYLYAQIGLQLVNKVETPSELAAKFVELVGYGEFKNTLQEFSRFLSGKDKKVTSKKDVLLTISLDSSGKFTFGGELAEGIDTDSLEAAITAALRSEV